jgi:hypothetical protein
MKLFLPQSQLEEWTLAEKADLREGALAIHDEPQAYPSEEAFHFTQVVSGQDQLKLVGKVKTLPQLASLGVEVMSGSAIAGETAYDVVPGYAVVLAQAAAAASPPAKAPATTGDEDLLAKFLLNKL